MASLVYSQQQQRQALLVPAATIIESSHSPLNMGFSDYHARARAAETIRCTMPRPGKDSPCEPLEYAQAATGQAPDDADAGSRSCGPTGEGVVIGV
jgi:hypothetical protein